MTRTTRRPTGGRLGWHVLRAGFFTLISVGAAAERVRFATVESAALGRTLPVAVVSPAATPVNGTTAPVLFLLHGRGRNHRSLLESTAARSVLLAAPYYIVLPQGEDGWYIDSPVRSADRYGTYLEEVLHWAETTLPVGRSAARRGIAGWSMGGYGAVRFAQTHPGVFGFVGSVIGLLDYPRPADLPAGQNYRLVPERFGTDASVWAGLNPRNHAEKLRGSSVQLVLATRGFERTMNENFLASLRAVGEAAEVHWLEGGHEFAVVERGLPLVVAGAERFFTERKAP